MATIYHFTDVANIDGILAAGELRAHRTAGCVVDVAGNAAAAFTSFYDDPGQLAEVVDWPLMEAGYWNNTSDDPDRRRRRCAEFLIHEAVPLGLIEELVVHDSLASSTVGGVVAAAASSIAVRIRSDWYF
jgi:hypothetical protein